MQRFYVTAIEDSHVFFLAGPYDCLSDAENHVDEARKIACDFERNKNAGRAAFMYYGVTGSTDVERKTALGVL